MPFALAMYDIASDRRRARVSELLADSGPRVQLSVFELELARHRDLTMLCDRLTGIIDHHHDQVRIYTVPTLREDRIILGNRVLQERLPYLIV
ncbi:CRISPR-associated endonuclease Cas2 [Rhodococcus sp. YH1]|uniref:CRISPR-associated endonuclease Cas2 n=1 Tax=Rhodococcus sp. YH1 TaxID=89066 RepID=UPI00138718CC|nr:CRISPR-associated endoribonuclease Cas2 [Rhodococcus sp. YH1]